MLRTHLGRLLLAYPLMLDPLPSSSERERREAVGDNEPRLQESQESHLVCLVLLAIGILLMIVYFCRACKIVSNLLRL